MKWQIFDVRLAAVCRRWLGPPGEKKLDKLEDQIQRDESGSLNFRESDSRHRSKTNHPRNVIEGALLTIKATLFP